MNRYFACGSVIGLVTNNADPDGLGRVKVGIYSLGKNIETNWIPVLRQSLGMFVIPELESQVLVDFIGDNPDLPYVSGVIWNMKQMPPLTGENAESERNKNGKNNLRFIRSRSGNRMILDDSKDKEKIQMITAKDAARIEATAEDKKILVKASIVKITASGKILVNSKECIIKSKSVITQSKDIKIESKSKDINIKAGNAIAVKGKGINLN